MSLNIKDWPRQPWFIATGLIGTTVSISTVVMNPETRDILKKYAFLALDNAEIFIGLSNFLSIFIIFLIFNNKIQKIRIRVRKIQEESEKISLETHEIQSEALKINENILQIEADLDEERGKVNDFVRNSRAYHEEFSYKIMDVRVENRNKSTDFRDFSVSFMNRLSNQIDILTNSETHLSVKYYHKSEKSVETIARDNRNSDRWKGRIQKYTTNKNTAFDDLVELKKSYYICNNLTELEEAKSYINSANDWTKFYNATLVVPICEHDHGAISTDADIWGFICADNMEGGFNRNCRILLSGFGPLVMTAHRRWRNDSVDLPME